MRVLSIAIAIMFVSGLAFAQDTKTDPVKPATKVAPKADDATKTDEPASPVKEIVGGVKEVIKKVGEVKKGENTAGEKIPMLLAIMALLAAIFKVLLSLLKVMSKFFKSSKGKTVMRLITVILGFATYLVSSMAMKMPWYEALTLSISGPGALVIHELSLVIPWLKNVKEKAKEV